MRNGLSGSRMQPPSASASTARASSQPLRRRSIMGSPTAVRKPSCAPRDEDVALVAHGADEARVLRIGLDLLAQPHHAQVDAAVERIPVALLRQVEDALAR